MRKKETNDKKILLTIITIRDNYTFNAKAKEGKITWVADREFSYYKLSLLCRKKKYKNEYTIVVLTQLTDGITKKMIIVHLSCLSENNIICGFFLPVVPIKC